MRRKLLALTMAACAAGLACDAEDPLEPLSTPNPAVLPATGASGITVMTRNIYLGFGIDQVLSGDLPLAQGLADLNATDFPKRAGMLAAEIQATRPHLIGLQEVIDYSMQVPSDIMIGNFTPNATDPVFHFLDILLDSMEARGLDYVVAVNNPTTDVEVPIQVAPGVFADIRYTDHDVILARSDVELGDATAQVYAARLPVTIPPLPPTARPLGYAAVEAVANGTPLLFVTTHLETQSFPAIQVAQAAELIDQLAGRELPIVLVGDFNSAANPGAPAGKETATYGMLLNAGYHDVWLRRNPFAAGLTCCFASDLASAGAFDQRIDLILVRDGAGTLVGGVHTALVGVDPVSASQPRWPSDHAGLVATLRLPQR